MELVTDPMKQEIAKRIDQAIRQGREIGWQVGWQTGWREGKRTLILRQLARRIGAISPETQARVQQLVVPELEDLSEALLDFTGAQDLEEWLRQDEQ